MNQTRFIALLGMIFLAGCQPSSKTETGYTLLQGATLYDGNGNSISQSKILIKDDRIEALGGPEMETPKNADIIDLTGKFITPAWSMPMCTFPKPDFSMAVPMRWIFGIRFALTAFKLD